MFLDSPIAIWDPLELRSIHISKTTNGHLIAHQSMDLSFFLSFSIRFRFGHFCLAKVSPSLCWSLEPIPSRGGVALLIHCWYQGTYNTSRLPYSFETETRHRGLPFDIYRKRSLYFSYSLFQTTISSSYSICRTLPVFPPHQLVSTFNIPNSSSRESVPDIT